MIVSFWLQGRKPLEKVERLNLFLLKSIESDYHLGARSASAAIMSLVFVSLSFSLQPCLDFTEGNVASTIKIMTLSGKVLTSTGIIREAKLQINN